MYIKVYSPDGEVFEVNRHVADNLILQQGWTQSCPEIVPVEPVEESDQPSLFTYEEEVVEPKRKRGRRKKEDTTE